MKIGVHVSIQGGLCEALKRAKGLGCNTMQIFSRNPRGWGNFRFNPEDISDFKKERARLSITPLVVHIPYLINLASPEDNLYKRSIQSFIEDIKASDEIGAEYFVTHLGSHKGMGEEFGIERFARALNIIISKTNPKLTLLLETTAGSGDWLGYKFEHLQNIINKIDKKEKIGVCLDTAHVYAAGYDIATKKGLDNTLSEFDKLIGLDRLKVVHLNDSMSAFGSRVDRHEHIGKGKIGKSGMRLILNHPKLKRLAFILETPKETKDADKKNLAFVKKLAM